MGIFHLAEQDIGLYTYVALAADHLVAVELGGKSLQGGLNDTTTQTENQVESGLLQIVC